MKKLALFTTFLLTLLAPSSQAVQINGQLEKAGLERLSSDPAGTFEGRIYENSTAHACVFYNGSAWKTLAISGSIANSDISSSAAIDFSKLATLTSAHVLVGSAGNVATDTAVTGDVTITNGGVTAIGSTKVTNAMLAGSIAYSKLSLTGAILNADLAGSIDLTSKVTGALPIGNGGTGQATKAAGYDALSPLTTLGDIVYGGASGTGTRLAGNTTSTQKFLAQTGTGTVSAAPGYVTLATGDLPSSIPVNKLAAQTASKVLVSDSSGFVTNATTTTTQVQYLASAGGTTGTTSTNIVFSTSPSIATPTLTGTVTAGTFDTGAASLMAFKINGTEYGEFSSGGKFIVGGAAGASAQSGRHELYINGTSDEVLQLRNMSTSSSSDGRAGLTIVKGSSTSSNAQIFAQFSSNTGSQSEGSIVAGAAGSHVPTFLVASDKRLKKNILPLADALPKLMSLNLVTWDWKDNSGRGRGILAQELVNIFPDWVVKSDDGAGDVVPDGKKPWQVSLGELPVYLAKAIQELAVKNAALEARLTQDEALIASLNDAITKRLEKLEKKETP